MKLPELAVKNHQFTLVIVILLVVVGTVSFLTMPRSEDPQFDFPVVIVTAVYPGTSPVDMEQLIADPIEEAINELEDIKEIRTTIGDGLVVTATEFRFGVDPDEKRDDITQAMSRIRSELPAGLHSLEIDKASPTDVNIFQVALMSHDASYGDLKLEAERLEKRFQRVAGVKKAEVWAFPDQQVEVRADLEKMRESGMALNRLMRSLESAAANIPAGFVDAGGRRFTVRTSGNFDSPDEIRHAAVKSVAGKTTYVRDIARVRLGQAEPTYLAEYNGRRALYITVNQRKGSNIFHVVGELDREMETFRSALPAGMSAEVVFDQSSSVTLQVNGFFNNLLQGLALVGLIMILALGRRAAIIVLMAIPVSIMIGIGGLDLAGFGLQQMSIVGLVIALGLLVDNAIVVTENIGRHASQGLNRWQAAIAGTGQVGWAIGSGTLTTMLAFLPMLLMQSSTGSFMRSMPVTVVLVLAASFLIAVTLTPLLASRFLTSNGMHKSGTKVVAKVAGRVRIWLEQLSQGGYARSLGFVLQRPVAVLLAASIVFVGSLSLFPQVGVSLFPKAEKPQLLVNIDLPESSSFYKTRGVAREVALELRRRPLVQSVASNIGHGNPSVYYNEFPKNETANHAQIFVQLTTREAGAVQSLVGDLRAAFRNYPGAKISVREFNQGPPIVAPIVVRILGDNLNTIQRSSKEVETLLAKVPGAINIENGIGTPKLDLHVTINRDKAAMVGVPIADIDRAVRTALTGSRVGSYFDENGEEYDVVVKLADRDTPTLDDLDRIVVGNSAGNPIPLSQLVSLEPRNAPAKFQHYNLERSAIVTADVAGGYQVAQVATELEKQLNGRDWPPGVRFQLGGEQESRGESFAGLMQALATALLGIFAILVLQFRSFVQPAIVFTAIPFAVTGAVLGLWITGYSFSVMAFVGLTSLVGIVVNNSIILIDYANRSLRAGSTVREAILDAGKTRLSPIVLTTLTTIGGLLPLTLEGSTLWSPLGWVIIGGLVVSTFLTLFVVPALYVLFTRKSAELMDEAVTT